MLSLGIRIKEKKGTRIVLLYLSNPTLVEGLKSCTINPYSSLVTIFCSLLLLSRGEITQIRPFLRGIFACWRVLSLFFNSQLIFASAFDSDLFRFLAGSKTAPSVHFGRSISGTILHNYAWKIIHRSRRGVPYLSSLSSFFFLLAPLQVTSSFSFLFIFCKGTTQEKSPAIDYWNFFQDGENHHFFLASLITRK